MTVIVVLNPNMSCLSGSGVCARNRITRGADCLISRMRYTRAAVGRQGCPRRTRSRRVDSIGFPRRIVGKAAMGAVCIGNEIQEGEVIMATQPRQANVPTGSTFTIIWGNDFTPQLDGCKAICSVQKLKPITKGGRFAKYVIAGIDRNNAIRFLSIMDDVYSKVPVSALNKALNKSRGIPEKYTQQERPYSRDAENLIKHMKALILNYF